MPLTLNRAKPAVAFAGKYRLIDIPISNCINSGIERQYVLTQFHSASLHRHVMQTYRFDNFSNGFVDILAAEQSLHGSNWFQGTADAVRATFRHINYYSPDLMLILSGDQVYRMDYRKLIRHHHESNADVTLGVVPVSRSEARQLGLLRVDTSGRVDGFVEKPDDPDVLEGFAAAPALFPSSSAQVQDVRYLASMGIYLFKTAILESLLSAEKLTDFGNEVIPAAIQNHRVLAYPFTDYWKDVGTIETFYEANIQMAAQQPAFELSTPEWPIYTHSRSLPPNRIMGSEIRDSLVAEGCRISGAHIAHSVIGTRSVVGKGSHLDGVVMLGADSYESEGIATVGSVPQRADGPGLGVGADCRIERAILDKDARIGDGVQIHSIPEVEDYRGDLYFIRSGIVVVPSGRVIPAGMNVAEHFAQQPK